MTAREAYRLNKEIEEFVQGKTTPYTEQDLAFVNQYSGFGGMWNLDSSLDADRGLYEYYTPWEIIEKMVGLAQKHGYTDGPVLEPSCGIGRFLHYFPATTEVVGVEPDATSVAIARANFPMYNIEKGIFNEFFVERGGKAKVVQPKFRLVIGNPPYGTFSGRMTVAEKAATGANTYPEYFVRRSADLLLSGGLCVFIIPSAFLNAAQGKIESDILDRMELLEAFRLPTSAFGWQTDIQTDIIVFRKK